MAAKAMAGREAAGFCDSLFEARYDGEPSAAPPVEAAAASGAAPAPAVPRSRNSYRRSRPRRLAAGEAA